MSTSMLAAVVAMLAAAVLTGMLVRRCVRAPRIDTVAWVCAGVGLTIALAAQALGFSQGFTPVTFRATQIGAQLIAPLALVWGLVEISAKRVGSRFAARLALGGLTVIIGVIMATDPLGSASFGSTWPAASVYYQLLPGAALELITVITVLAALVAALMAGLRARRGPLGRELLIPVAAAAGAALLTEALRATLPVNSGYPVLCLAAAALTWFAGTRAAGVRLAAGRAEAGPDGPETGWGGYDPYGDDTGFGGLYQADTGGFPRARDDTGYGDDVYRADTGYGDRYGTDTGYGELYRDDTGGYRLGGDGADTGFGLDGTDTGSGLYREPDTGLGLDGPYGTSANGMDAGLVETGDMLPVPGDGAPPAPPAAVDMAQFYGQIAIYTLLDGGAEHFDTLARQVAEEVRSGEPGTLVYVMHSVPTAPMQRILYEIYRDEVAFADHQRQSYVQQFEEGRKPYVLATNVIELGIRHAKVLPLEGPPGPPGGRPGALEGPPGPPGGRHGALEGRPGPVGRDTARHRGGSVR